MMAAKPNDSRGNDQVRGGPPSMGPRRHAILDPYALMIDLDPEQWTHWYDLLFKPNRSRDGLYILHDKGRILSVTPIYARSKLSLPTFVKDPVQLSKDLYDKWQRGPVAILEYGRLKSSIDKSERQLDPNDEDFFTLFLKTKDLLLYEADYGIAIYPHPLAHWRNLSSEFPSAIVSAIGPNGRKFSIVVAIYDGELLWASVLLGFENGLLKLVTSLPSRAASDPLLEWTLEGGRLAEIAADLFSPVGFGLMCQRSVVDRLGIGPENWLDWIGAATRGELLCLPDKVTFLQIIDELRKALARSIR